MTAVQPFSYLTVQPAPSKPAFQRQDDLVETSDYGGFRSGEPTTQEDTSHVSQSTVALPNYQQDYQRPQANLSRAQTETSYDLRQLHQQQQQQRGEAYIDNRVKRAPDVAPKHVKALDPRLNENWESPKLEEGAYGATEGALYAQSNPLALNRLPENKEPVRDPDSGNADNLYGQMIRHREPDSQDSRKPISMYAPPSDVPFSYTQPIGLAGVVTYGDMESRNGVGSKHHYTQSELGNRVKEPPPAVSSAIENQTIFENFILVGPEKPQVREAPPKEPGRRLKLQELFDPPPPQAPVAQDPRKLSIFGVTNTESSDFHSTANSRPTDSDRTKMKTPVSTFDNPDYNIQQDRTYRPYGYVQPGMRDDRPWSAAAGSNNALDGAGKGVGASAHRRPTQGRCQSNKMCAAVLITMLITSIVCLGAGFAAGWFGRERAPP